ncbi:MAG: heavy metal sensor histidine kinase [Gammaproteobacteria bacterium]|nr:heavy metal sensor histidine kinase [Gammaproteobacteria bacterium]MBU1654952.1 heavy metal sensor histidine kinase [Gammaproteobacteria bacterium]MBU1960504.1 heavy metal sensor histidine kinase [Gammaproteobacteria bacterium]
MIPRSIALRFALTSFLGTALILSGLGLYLLRAVEAHFESSDRAELEGALHHLGHMARTEQGLSGLPEQVETMRLRDGPLRVRLEQADGRVLLDSLGFSIATTGSDFTTLEAGGNQYRLLSAPVETGNGEVLHAYLAADLGRHLAFMERFRLALQTAIAVALLLSVGLSLFASRWGLTPLTHMRELLRTVSGERLHMRLRPGDLPLELRGLSVEFNQMLERLDESFRRLSQFSSDIAHELRTPVTNLMTQTQVALSGARDVDQYREILYSNLEEYERMAQMVGDMLFLAQADYGLLQPGTGTVDLAIETRGLFDYFDAWAEERGVSLALEGELAVPGDRLMLRRALSNLLSNAIRHTPAGGVARVKLSAESGTASIRVENPGPGISPEQLPRLFDRFYRVDPSRQRRGDGAGLGLAIVKSIIEAHGGTLSVASAGGLTCFRIGLPIGGPPC